MSDVLRYSVDRTRDILRQELEIQRAETLEQLHNVSLEKIFIMERIYKDKEFENAKDQAKALKHIDKRLTPFKPQFYRDITEDDLLRLLEIPMKRIIKYNNDKADENIAKLNERIKDIDDKLAHLTKHAIKWFEGLKAKYGAKYPRRTIIREFDTIVASKVAEANQKLYINRADGFIGTGLKKDEFVCNCSDIDDIIIFYKDGKFKVTKVADKIYVGKNVIYLNVFKKGDSRTIYNAMYQDGKGGTIFMKRFPVTGVTRDREYDITQGKPGSKVIWFTANPNGEAEVVRVTLKPKFRLKILQFDVNFADLAIKGKQARGNIVTKNEVHRLSLKEQGASTLGDREVWFDPDILRINYEGHGRSLGLFGGEDRILVIMENGDFYTTSAEATNHYEQGILRIEKFDKDKVWTAVLDDADQGHPYVKRYTLEDSTKKQSMIGGNPESKLLLLSDDRCPRFEVTMGGADAFREAFVIDAEEFIGVKTFKAKGKRVTNWEVQMITALEPREPEPGEEETPTVANTGEENVDTAPAAPDSKAISQEAVLDKLTGQQRLPFDDFNYNDDKTDEK